MRVRAAPSFLNVDLDLATGDPAPLRAGLRGLFVLRDEPGHLSFEVDGPSPSIEATLAALCAAVEGLGGEARASWDRCTARDFNVGLESGVAGPGGGRAFEGRISAETLARIAALGATLSVTVYPVLGLPPDQAGRLGRARVRRR